MSKRPRYGYYWGREDRSPARPGRWGKHLVANRSEGGLLYTSEQGIGRSIPRVVLQSGIGSLGRLLPGYAVKVAVAEEDILSELARARMLVRACTPLSQVPLTTAWGGGDGAANAVIALLRLGDEQSWGAGAVLAQAEQAAEQHRRLLQLRARRLPFAGLDPAEQARVRQRPTDPDCYLTVLNEYIDNREADARAHGLQYAWDSVFSTALVITSQRLHIIGGSKYLLEMSQPSQLAVAGALASLLLGGDRLLNQAWAVWNHSCLLLPGWGWGGWQLRAVPISETLSLRPLTVRATLWRWLYAFI